MHRVQELAVDPRGHRKGGRHRASLRREAGEAEQGKDGPADLGQGGRHQGGRDLG